MIAILVLALLTSHCSARGPLPDPTCTPGAVATTSLAIICGTTTEGRRHVTDATKRAVLASYGVAWADHGAYEVDHLVPLEIGGSNDVANLWPEPWAEAHIKDVAENRAHREVCAGRVTVEAAQAAFERDWPTSSASGPGTLRVTCDARRARIDGVSNRRVESVRR